MKLFPVLLYIFFLSGLLLSQSSERLNSGKAAELQSAIANGSSSMQAFIDKKRSELKNINIVQVKKNPEGISEVIFMNDRTRFVHYFDNRTGQEVIIDSKESSLQKENNVNYVIVIGYFYKDAYYQGQTREVYALFSSNGSYEVSVYGLDPLDISSHRFAQIVNPGYTVTTTKVKVYGSNPSAEHYDYMWYDDNYDDECLSPSNYPMWLCYVGANDNVVRSIVQFTVSNIPIPPLTLSISGPTHLAPNVNGTWTATAGGGVPAYHYQWYLRYQGGAAKNLPSPLKPPPGIWFKAGSDSRTFTYSDVTSFSVKCEVTDNRGTLKTSNVINVNIYQDIAIKGKGFSVGNYPNPLNPSTEIFYELPEACKVEIKIFDMLGREVTQFINEYKDAGRYSASFDASSLSNGMYFYRIIAANGSKILFTATNKMLLIK